MTAPPRDLRNQCAGCAQGLELRGWSHYKDGLPWVRCTGYEYAPAPSADAVHGPFESMDDLIADLKAPAAQPASPRGQCSWCGSPNEICADCGHKWDSAPAPPATDCKLRHDGGQWFSCAACGHKGKHDAHPSCQGKPHATDDLVRDLNDWVRTFAYDAPLRRCIERAADTIERQAREIAEARQLFNKEYNEHRESRRRLREELSGERDRHKRTAERAERAEAELHKANIDSANMMAECSDLSVDVEKYRQEIAALRLAVKDDAQWAQENERLTRELDRVKVQLTSEITTALVERDAAMGSVNVLKNSLSACIAERDALKCELEITCAHLGLDKLLADRDALRADAERYRWIRRSDTPSMEVIARKTDEYGVELYFGDELDAAIDAARAKVKT